jgi:purine-binding chemotaxis protein CheW
MNDTQASHADIAEPGADRQFLSFLLGDEAYGVDILRVQEIRGWAPVRALPDVPDYVNGVLDLRGIIVPVIDLRTRFNLAGRVYSPTTVVIILSVRGDADDGRLVGAVVDAVSDVLDVKADALRPAPKLGCCVGSRYLTGMVTVNGRMVVMLDADKLFADDEFALLDEVAAEGGRD